MDDSSDAGTQRGNTAPEGGNAAPQGSAGHRTDSGWAPPPPPPPAGFPPPLTRSVDDRVLAGVAGGLGAHFRIDPWIVRVAFVALSFAGGIGLVLYVAAWALLPEAGSPHGHGWDSVVHLQRNHGRALAGGVLIVAAVVFAAGSFHFNHEGVLWGLALVGLGVFLLVQDRWQPARRATEGQAFAAPTYAPAYAAASFGAPAASGAAPVAWTPAARATAGVRRQRSVLGLVTIAAALLVVGIAALLDSAGVVSVSVATGAAIALIVVGAGLIAGTWFGRSRLLIAFGIVLIPVTVTTSLVHEPLSGGTGAVTVAPQTLADVQSEYHLAAGSLSLDLSQVAVGSASRTVTATVAFGQLTVTVPQGVTVDVRGHAGFGELDLLGSVDDGVSIDATASQPVVGATTSPSAGITPPQVATPFPSAGSGALHLDLSVGFGRVYVVRAATGAEPPAKVP